MDQTKRPGSPEGRRELAHWHYENGPVTKAQRAFLCAEVRKRITDPVKRADVIKWVTSSRTSIADVAQLCRRWGIDLPRTPSAT